MPRFRTAASEDRHSLQFAGVRELLRGGGTAAVGRSSSTLSVMSQRLADARRENARLRSENARLVRLLDASR